MSNPTGRTIIDISSLSLRCGKAFARQLKRPKRGGRRSRYASRSKLRPKSVSWQAHTRISTALFRYPKSYTVPWWILASFKRNFKPCCDCHTPSLSPSSVPPASEGAPATSEKNPQCPRPLRNTNRYHEKRRIACTPTQGGVFMSSTRENHLQLHEPQKGGCKQCTEAE